MTGTSTRMSNNQISVEYICCGAQEYWDLTANGDLEMEHSEFGATCGTYTGTHQDRMDVLQWQLAKAQEQITDLRETVEDLARQFAIPVVTDGVSCLSTGGLSALEDAFYVLGWDDPFPVPEQACAADGCAEWATCGTPTPDGYQRLCTAHYLEVTGT